MRHRKDDGSVFTLAEVIRKAKAWETSASLNAHVIEAQKTAEQVNFTAKNERSRSRTEPEASASGSASQSRRGCGFCGGDNHSRRLCPASKPGVVCYHCFGRNHFASVCRSSKNRYKSQWVSSCGRPDAKGGKSSHIAHAVELESSCEDRDAVGGAQYALSLDYVNQAVHAVSNNPKKVFVTLALSLHSKRFTDVTFQVDTVATCNTIPYDLFRRLATDCDLRKSSSTLVSYAGESIKPRGKVDLICDTGTKRFDVLSFEVVNLPGKPALLGLSDSMRLSLISFDERRVHSASANSQAAEMYSMLSGGGPLTKEYILQRKKETFEGLGCLGQPVTLILDPHVKPVHAPVHRIPVGKREKVKEKLDEMVAAGKLTPVDEPTDWCSNMTVVEKVKPDGSVKLRLCLDPSQTLNKAVVIPKHTVPTLEEILPRLSAKKHKCFSIFDALDGFTQVPLDDKSSFYTTMQTPWGRYRWLRLPYGVSSAPEEFQRRIQEALDGLNGIANIADDILCFGLGDTWDEAEAEHDRHLLALLERAGQRNLKLNPSKIQFKLPKISFMGHEFTEQGVLPDPAKVEAISQMPQPRDKKALQRFLGMINYLSPFCPALSSIIHPLYNLTHNDVPFVWSAVHSTAFRQATELVSSAPCLAYFDLRKPITLQVDASETGLGGALLQPDSTGKLQPVAFMSCQLKLNEALWAQIEKEALAICAALCEVGPMAIRKKHHSPH